MIFLVCRAETIGDGAADPFLAGNTRNVTLTQAGRRCAQTLAAALAARNVCAVYSSPMPGAVQTASIISAACDAALTFCSALADVATGKWAGLSMRQAMCDPAFGTYIQCFSQFQYPGGETIAAACARVSTFIRELFNRHNKTNAVAVTHGAISRLALAALLGLDAQRAREIEQTPGCFNVIRACGGQLHVGAVNLIATEDMPAT